MAETPRQTSASKWTRFFESSIGRKYLTGITGAALVLFLIVHLLGNLTLFVPDGGAAFNTYAQKLHSLGPLLYVLEIGLLSFILLHAVIGVSIWIRKRKARPHTYEEYRSVGGASKQTISSRSMLITGVVIFLFLLIHVSSFRFGVGFGSGYDTVVDGHETRDLFAMVRDAFQIEALVIFYLVVVALVGFHLRHGIWSALQSLAAMRPRASALVYSLALVMAILLGLGFFLLPIYMYFAY